MSNEPPSLAARLEKDGPLSWREAARLAARVARALDRLHAQGKAHGGIEPLTILFVGGTIRLADPLPPATRGKAFVAPHVAAGEPPDRHGDFHALGQVMAAMLTGDPHAPGACEGLPPPLAAVQRRLVEARPGSGYGSGNDVAAALELAIAASEGFAVVPPPPPLSDDDDRPPPEPRHEPPPQAERARPHPSPEGTAAGRPAMPPAGRRRSAALVSGLVALLLLAGLAVLWLWDGAEVALEAPATLEPLELAAPEPPPRGQTVAPGQEAAADTVGPATERSIEEVLAALPDDPLGPLPSRPDAQAQVAALMAEVATWPCSRLEVEPAPVGLRLVGSTRNAADRAALLAAVGGLPDVDRVTVGLMGDDVACRLYDLLATSAEAALPRLADLYPSRGDYRLAAAEPLVVRVLTPAFPSHVMVDYFTADGMVVHLAKREVPRGLIEPRTELRIGDPAEGQALTIAEPFGHELILVLASRAPLFAEPRPQIEPAETYLEALEEALAGLGEPPVASTMAIETVPSHP